MKVQTMGKLTLDKLISKKENWMKNRQFLKETYWKTYNNSKSLSQIQATQKVNSDKFHAKQNFILENLLTNN